MQVIFSHQVLADPSSWIYLDRILETVERELHVWEVDDADAIEQSQWFIQAGRYQPVLRTLLELSVRRGAWSRRRGPHSLVVVVHVESAVPCVLAASVAVDFLREPLIVLVENVTSDGAFLDALLEILGDQTLRKLLRELTMPALKYDAPGGNGELIKRLDHHLESGYPAGMPRRLMVVTDSDAKAPGKWSSKASTIAENCRKRGIICHVLQKRAIENYLPQEVMEDWASDPSRVNARPLVAAMGRLSEQQRDHVPLKNGLPATLEPEEQALYKGVTSADLDLLSRHSKKRNNDWSALYRTHRSRMTPEALRKRAGLRHDGSTELDELIETIGSLL